MDNRQAFFLYGAATKLVDAVVVVLVWHLCWLLRFKLSIVPLYAPMPEASIYHDASLPLALVFLATFHIVGAYRHDRIEFGFRSLRKVIQSSIIGSLVFVSTVYFQGAIIYSRIYLLIFSVLVIVGLCLGRGLLFLVWLRVKKNWIRPIRSLIVGNGQLLEMYLTNLDRRNPYPVDWFGRLGSKEASEQLRKIPFLGEESRLKKILDNEDVDQVVISYGNDQNYQEVLEKLSDELVAVKVLPDYGRQSTFTYSADHEVGVPLLHFNREPVGFSDRFLKRTFDFVGSLLLLIVASPLMLLIGALIKLTSKGPAIYSQKRVGADGKEFVCYKFRTMRVDAEEKTGPVWASEEDTRTTAIGKWLRRTSLDELPQFFNILMGDMSLVGPRPERPNFVAQFRDEIPKYMLRHKMKSGITGWAQVNGLRANTSLKKRVRFDLYYIGHWSHLFDLKIILLTPLILVRDYLKKNAY